MNIKKLSTINNMGKYIFSHGYSLRRFYVDEFFRSNIKLFNNNVKIVDIGGKKVGKRGRFNINSYDLRVSYVNIDKKSQPDYLCDASKIQIKNESFDGAIVGELLEHVEYPVKVLKEVYRILKKGGVALITIPFLYPIHADPTDFGRYTDYYFKIKAKKIGFSKITIYKHGNFYSVLANLINIYLYNKSSQKPFQYSRFILFMFLNRILTTILMFLEEKTKRTKFLYNFTTGYGLVLIK